MEVNLHSSIFDDCPKKISGTAHAASAVPVRVPVAHASHMSCVESWGRAEDPHLL